MTIQPTRKYARFFSTVCGGRSNCSIPVDIVAIIPDL